MARRTDPTESHAAADRHEASGRVERHRRAALALVRAHPGRTSRELGEIAAAEGGAGFECKCDATVIYHELARRLPEVEEHGLVRAVSVPGKRAREWWPREEI